MGAQIGQDAFLKASRLYGPWPTVQVDRIDSARRGRTDLVSVVGSCQIGVFGPEDVLDVSQGVRITLRDARGRPALFDFDSGDCRGRQGGVLRCLARGGTNKLYFWPGASAQQSVNFRLTGRQDSRSSPESGPVQVTITTGETERSGTWVE